MARRAVIRQSMPRATAILIATAALAGGALGCSTETAAMADRGLRGPAAAGTERRHPHRRPAPPDRAQVERAVKLASAYLRSAVGSDGRFDYLVRSDGQVDPKAYNELRHAGTIYAMAQAHARYPGKELGASIERAVAHLQQRYLAPVPGKQGMWAIWSGGRREQAKLGGAGLALLGMIGARQQLGDGIDTQAFEPLGVFLRHMQREDGSFYSKYFTGDGPSDSWRSLYYPGEAALGLLRLYRFTKDERWRDSAIAALEYLARSRKGQADVPADHWALLATADALPLVDGRRRALLMGHALQVVDSMLAGRPDQIAHAALSGCLTDDGRTTPTATRLEGLQAVLPLIPASRPRLRQTLKRAIDGGLGFLLRAQKRSGSLRGGMPRAMRQSGDDRAEEVRIDYAQHAMSAWLQYLDAQPGDAQPNSAGKLAK
jgi:hypothetical protein